ncbi:adiponectin-like [Ptychodera flava]|uniref:adiponectin-like n=1 Tax=Ptychodera flava TaxID=63121 RepID=UPI00396A0DE3
MLTQTLISKTVELSSVMMGIPVIRLFLISLAFSNAVFASAETDQPPCVHCCDYQPTNTPGVFSILRGEKGDTGEPGQNGIVGKAGPIGETGLKGVKGEKGYKGETGSRGPAGERGITGSPGLKGERGFEGLKGTRGNPGVKGQKGEVATTSGWSSFGVARSSAINGGDDYKTVTYDHTFINTANHMSPSTGVFTCQIPGVYFFAFVTMKDPGTRVAAFIMQNNSKKARIYADDKDWEGMVSQSVTLHLAIGDRVWVRIDKRSEFDSVSLESNGKRHTIFNGHLIHRSD